MHFASLQLEKGACRLIHTLLFYLTLLAPSFHEFVQLLKLWDDGRNYSVLIEWFRVPSFGFPFTFPG